MGCISDKKKVEKQIVYLSDKKNIVCLNGTYIDLNLVVSLRDCGNNLEFMLVSGETMSIGRESYSRSYKGLPNKYRSSTYDIYDVKLLLKDLGPEFSYYATSSYREDKYAIYNKHETDKLVNLIESQWVKVKNRILNKWAGIGDSETKLKVINSTVIFLMIRYYELNKGNNGVLDDMHKIFGYGLDEILNIMDIKEDYYVTKTGEIVMI